MASIEKSQLQADIKDILKDADLNQLSAKKVRKQLEEKYDTDLIDRKKEIDELLMLAIEEQANGDASGKDEDDDNDDDDKKTSKRSNNEANNVSTDDSDDEGVEDLTPPKKKVKATVKTKKKEEDKGGDVSSDEDDEEVARKLQEEEDSGKRRTRGGGRTPVKPKKVRKNTGTKKGKGTGYSAPCLLSETLAGVVGADELPQSEVVKRIWDIAKERDLFDPSNRQFVKCDDELFGLFGRKRLRLFGMMKYLKKHIHRKHEVV